jgi:hypothetical protein
MWRSGRKDPPPSSGVKSILPKDGGILFLRSVDQLYQSRRRHVKTEVIITQMVCIIFILNLVTMGGIRGHAVASLDIFNSHNPSRHTIALGSTQPLIGISTRDLPGRIRLKTSLPSVSQFYRKWGSHVSKRYGSPRPVTGIALHIYGWDQTLNFLNTELVQ